MGGVDKAWARAAGPWVGFWLCLWGWLLHGPESVSESVRGVSPSTGSCAELPGEPGFQFLGGGHVWGGAVAAAAGFRRSGWEGVLLGWSGGELKGAGRCVSGKGDPELGIEQRREGGRKGSEGVEEDLRGRCAQQARSTRPGPGRWGAAGEVREGNSSVPGPLCTLASVVLILTFFFSAIMDKYQEQPHLLDPHLGKRGGLITLILVTHYRWSQAAWRACLRACLPRVLAGSAWVWSAGP